MRRRENSDKTAGNTSKARSLIPKPATAVVSMYNLLVSSNAQAWNGEPWQIEFSRCVCEYTENAITERFGALDDAAVSELKRLPCIFA
ncbi:hypothetical protein ABIF68_009367 [Bradyrhizobium japonicum]